MGTVQTPPKGSVPAMFGDQERDENTRIDRVHIGEVVERTGLSHRTIRYYEEMGLISPSARTDGGFRLYEEADIKRLLLIKPMKPLGFTVEEMGQLLEALDALQVRGESASAQETVRAIHTKAQRRIADLRLTIKRSEEFTRMLDAQVAGLPPATD